MRCTLWARLLRYCFLGPLELIAPFMRSVFRSGRCCTACMYLISLRIPAHMGFTVHHSHNAQQGHASTLR